MDSMDMLQSIGLLTIFPSKELDVENDYYEFAMKIV